MPTSYTTQKTLHHQCTPNAHNSSCPCSPTHMKSASCGDHQVACIVPGNTVALPDLLLAVGAAPDGHCVATSLMLLIRLLAACAPVAQALALNDRSWSRRRLNKRV
eukprot:364531-Chlamydomonas_euryale.AAC.19